MPRRSPTTAAASTSRGRTAPAGLAHAVGGSGPWRDCLAGAAPVSVGDLSALRSRSPAAVRAWTAGGFRSVHAVPILVRDESVGSLTLLSPRPGALAPVDLAAVQVLVGVGATGLLQDRLAGTAHTLPAPVRRALTGGRGR